MAVLVPTEDQAGEGPTEKVTEDVGIVDTVETTDPDSTEVALTVLVITGTDVDSDENRTGTEIVLEEVDKGLAVTVVGIIGGKLGEAATVDNKLCCNGDDSDNATG